ncbi:DsbA family protein [Pseudaminobacter sp. 19-2017]|uniref:DsbA family protein n=1 Tax=Pseudaminobacter soli (ex Zhang et al. 2022) TaxID=2831468 RepID=A0A942ICC3_9HYPH|nr:thioredoxin domain-containing protein [Pseudaminobacter soli]MBS3652551.1 DsbA family protein [Pseudaminobacter soli]
MLNRRHLLKATAAGLATAVLPLPALAQPELTVEEVLFDLQIPVLGNPDGDVTIAEYFDYQCPFCKRGHKDLMEVVREDGKVRLVMKDWPILGAPSVHASSLVLAAGKDYEKALHALMSTKGRLSNEDVDAVLKKAGLDPETLLAAFKKDQDRIDGILGRNMDQANAFGFGGTPAFLVNTRVHHGAMDKQALRDSIAAARKN